MGVTPELAELFKANENLILPAAPIQDAIDLSRFLVETTVGFVRYAGSVRKVSRWPNGDRRDK